MENGLSRIRGVLPWQLLSDVVDRLPEVSLERSSCGQGMGGQECLKNPSLTPIEARVSREASCSHENKVLGRGKPATNDGYCSMRLYDLRRLNVKRISRSAEGSCLLLKVDDPQGVAFHGEATEGSSRAVLEKGKK